MTAVATHRCSRGRNTALRWAALLLGTAAWASDEIVQPGTYDITVRTVLPHLEENLRYTTTRERRCLRGDELPAVFPILQSPSLDGCKLGNERRRGGTIRYQLVCESAEVATGMAQLSAGPSRIIGSLEIKMGGKNMTFSQRVEATRQGDCELASPAS